MSFPEFPAGKFPAFLIPQGSHCRGCSGNRGCRSEQCLKKRLGVCGSSSRVSLQGTAASQKGNPDLLGSLHHPIASPGRAPGDLLSLTPFPEAGTHSRGKLWSTVMSHPQAESEHTLRSQSSESWGTAPDRADLSPVR